jgi:hypothetical protein
MSEAAAARMKNPLGMTTRMTARAPYRTMAGVFATSAAVVTAWTILLAFHVSSDSRTVDWTLVWCGLDGLEAAAMGLTAWLLHRRDGRAGLVAAALATSMLVDAWFDVTTARPDHFAVSVVMALTLEIPFALGCSVLALRLRS